MSRPEQREALRWLYNFRCGYYGVSEVDNSAELTVDHFQPRSQGGTDAVGNLVYCCHACNAYKDNYYQPEASERILHPLRDNLPEHILEQEDGTLYALTPTGVSYRPIAPQSSCADCTAPGGTATPVSPAGTPDSAPTAG